LIDVIIRKKFIRGDYEYLKNDELSPIKNLGDALENLHLRDDVEELLNAFIDIDISIEY